MALKDAQPSEDYKGLKIQFFAMKRLLLSQDAKICVYEKRIKEFSVDRIIQLESELESQKEMNAILTDELSGLNR